MFEIIVKLAILVSGTKKSAIGQQNAGIKTFLVTKIVSGANYGQDR